MPAPRVGLFRRGAHYLKVLKVESCVGAGQVAAHIGGLVMKISFFARQWVALAASLALQFAAPAHAIDGQILITHARALAGGVTPGDAPGYPVTITTPGSYKLGGNLQAPPSKAGIDVNAVEVTIDLNGFRINGDRTGAPSTGVRGLQRNLLVRNGTIRNFRGSGIFSGHGLTVTDMNINENVESGVRFDAGSGFGRIVNNTIMQNGAVGIYCGVGCHIEGNIVSANLSMGVYIEKSATIIGNSIMNNGEAGVYIEDAAKVGLGNNTIVDNRAGSISGPYVKLHPNACTPACP